MEVPSTIFRKYDIRGVAVGDDAQLTPDVANAVGKAYGVYVQREFGITQVFVGGDKKQHHQGFGIGWHQCSGYWRGDHADSVFCLRIT